MGDPVTATIVSTAVSKAVGTIQQQAQARAQQRAAQAAENREIERRRLEQRQRESAQRAETKRRQASARAAFGARGVSSASGSADALLGGMAAETERAIADDRARMDFGIETLRENQRAARRQSLLSSRNSLLNDIVDEGLNRLPSFFQQKPSGDFGTGNHPGER